METYAYGYMVLISMADWNLDGLMVLGELYAVVVLIMVLLR